MNKKRLFEFRMDSGLLTDFVSSDSINLFVTFDRNNFGTVCVNGMIAAFPEQVNAIFHQMSDGVRPDS